jgi:uncharacterized protein (DUF2267 family)
MTDPDDRPEPSTEAKQAIESARHARVATEAVLPLAEQLRDRLTRAMAADQFGELLEATLREATRNRLRQAGFG